MQQILCRSMSVAWSGRLPDDVIVCHLLFSTTDSGFVDIELSLHSYVSMIMAFAFFWFC